MAVEDSAGIRGLPVENFAQYLLASSPAIIFTCKAGEDYGGTYVSENIREYLGYCPEEFLGASGFWKEHVHPGDLPRVLAGLEEVFVTGHHVCEYRFQAKSGEYRWMRDELRLVHNATLGRDELVGSWLDVTEQKVKEEIYRCVVELTSDYIHKCTRTGTAPFRIQWVEGAIKPISGYSLEDLLFLDCWLPLVHPDDRPAVSSYLFSLIPGDSKEIEFRIVTKLQGVRWVLEKSHCQAGPSDGELVLYGAVTDITERKRAEEALRDSEGFLHEAARIARLGRWRWSISADELDWSTVMFEIFGRSPHSDKITFKDFIGAVHPEERCAVEEAVRDALQSGKSYFSEHRIVLENGTLRHVQERGQVHYSADGKPTTMVGTVLDVSQQKLTEQRLRESDQIKNEFIATASHELRTPLSIIQGYSELLLDNDVFGAEKQRNFLSIINDKAIALGKIVDDLLDVSRIEIGRIVCLEFGKSNLIEKIREFVSQFQQEVPSHRFSLILPMPREEIWISIDEAKIIQVMENLVGNAIKFSPRGSEIVVGADLRDSCLQIMVADEGMGIPAEKQAHIFDKFYRVDATNTAVPGLGIGLYLVKKIVEAHGGEIWLESTSGEGAKFFFTLPLTSH